MNVKVIQKVIREKFNINMTQRDVQKHISSKGWKLERQSGDHDVYGHEKAKHKLAVPRHKGNLAPGTVRQIMKNSILEAMVTNDASPITTSIPPKDEDGEKIKLSNKKTKVILNPKIDDSAITEKDVLDKEKVKKLDKKLQTQIKVIDELSKPTLGSYVKKATDDQLVNGLSMTKGFKDSEKYEKNSLKRRKGIGRAIKKLTKEELSPKEINNLEIKFRELNNNK